MTITRNDDGELTFYSVDLTDYTTVLDQNSNPGMFVVDVPRVEWSGTLTVEWTPSRFGDRYYRSMEDLLRRLDDIRMEIREGKSVDTKSKEPLPL